MAFSLMNGLSSLGAGVAQYAGTAGLELQKADLAKQSLVLADQLATTRETGLQKSAGDIAEAAQTRQQTFQAGQQSSQQTFQSGQTDKELAARASEGALSRSGQVALEQMRLNAPSPEIKSAKQFSTLSPDEKQAYREEMGTKAGLPPWMLTPPTGSPSDAPTAASDGSTAGGGTGASTAPATGAPVTGAPATPDPGATRNDRALEGVPGAAASIIKGMVDGRISPPSSFALTKPYWQGLISKAAEYDPTFDQTTWAGRVATKKDFASGKSAQAVTALNTALGHAGVVDDALSSLNNGSVPFLNSMENWTLGAFGSARPTNAQMAVDALASEARKVFAGGGGGNLTELQEWQKNFPINGSPDQQKGAMRQFTNLLDSRLGSLSDQYNRGMGRTDDPMNLLQPHAKAVYEKLTGREPTDATGYQMGTPTVGTPAGTGSAAAGAPAALPMPKTADDAIAGKIYNTGRGPARWDGSQFLPVQ